MTSTHEPFDDTTKTFYRRLFENWGLTVETEREIFFRGRAIDLVVTCPDSQPPQLQDTVFAHFRQINAIELKGIHDPLTLIDYNRIMMRVWGLGALETKPEKSDQKDETEMIDDDDELENDIINRMPNDRTVTMVCVTRPNKILNQLKGQLKFVSTEESGIYRCDERLSQWIIHPTELALIPKNYPLLPLARGKKLEQFIALCVRDGLVDYLQLITDIGLLTDPDVILRKILEFKQMKPAIHKETLPYIGQLLREMPEMWEIPFFKDALNASQQQGEQQGKLHNQQRILIRQLQRKFTQVPENIMQKIQSTTDLEQLDNWLDQIVVAKSLADTGLMVTEKNDKTMNNQ